MRILRTIRVYSILILSLIHIFCALKWSDINVYDGILTVNRTIERIYIIEGERKHTELVINTPKTKKLLP